MGENHANEPNQQNILNTHCDLTIAFWQRLWCHTSTNTCKIAQNSRKTFSNNFYTKLKNTIIILVLTSKSGSPNSTFLSIRPGLMRAGSRVSGRLVAMRTLMFPRGSNPSNWFINSNMVRCTSLELPSPSLNLVPIKKSTCMHNKD